MVFNSINNDKLKVMSVVIVISLLCLSGVLTGVYSNPGRPTIPDNPAASTIFGIAEANRNSTPDGFLSVEEMQEIFVNFDMDANQCIDMTEFIAHWNNLKLGDLQEAVTLFHHADTDRDGCIEKDPDYARLFYYFDRDGNGKISETEFKNVWYSLST